MISVKIINLALKDIDHPQDQITNMSNLRERERERERSMINTEIPTTMLLLCKHIFFYGKTERETENN